MSKHRGELTVVPPLGEGIDPAQYRPSVFTVRPASDDTLADGSGIGGAIDPAAAAAAAEPVGVCYGEPVLLVDQNVRSLPIVSPQEQGTRLVIHQDCGLITRGCFGSFLRVPILV